MIFSDKRLHGFGMAMMATLSLGFGYAHEYGKSGINVDHPWARPTLSKATPAAAYFIIQNTTAEDDKLLSAVIGQDVAAQAELHQTTNVEGVSRMRAFPAGMDVPAGAMLRFEPGGRHIMLFGLKERLQEGREFPLTLMFEKAGAIDVIVHVEVPDGARNKADDHDHHE